MSQPAPINAIVYQATNRLNGHRYIGFTTQGLALREKQHRKAAHDTQRKFRFHHALREFGNENFVFEVLGDFEDDDELAKIYEREAIEKYKPEYNLSMGGAGGRMNDEVRARMSAVRMGRKLSDEAKNKIRAAAIDRVQGNWGVKRSPAAIAKMLKTKAAKGPMLPQPKGQNGKYPGCPPNKPFRCVTDSRVFETLVSAASFYKMNSANIRDALKGRRPHVRGLVFQYLNESHK